jgi:hypothetical protein
MMIEKDHLISFASSRYELTSRVHQNCRIGRENPGLGLVCGG